MKNNKKGFTLIELLAVIVILAIIMVIAVPRILDVINSSRSSAWNSNVKLIDEAITLNTNLSSTGMSTGSFSLSSICTTTKSDITSSISSIADISSTDTKVECQKSGTSYNVTISSVSSGKFGTQTAVNRTY